MQFKLIVVQVAYMECGSRVFGAAALAVLCDEQPKQYSCAVAREIETA